MCSGRVDLSFIFRAFLNGMDGVFIGGCHLNECNYVTHGNYHALNMVLLAKRIMAHIGLNPDRLVVEFMSGAEAGLFVDVVNRFVKRVKTIGPLGESEGLDHGEVKRRIAEVTKLIPYIKLVNQAKLSQRLTDPKDYESHFTQQEIDDLFRNVVSYFVDPEKCQACSTCLKRCPVVAMEGGKLQVHVIDQEKCIKCGTCYEVCPPKFGAVTKLIGEPAPEPPPLQARAIKRKAKSEATA